MYVYHTVNRYQLPGLSLYIDHIINQIKKRGHRTLLSLKKLTFFLSSYGWEVLEVKHSFIYPNFTHPMGRLNLVGAPLSGGPEKVVISLQKWMPPKAMGVSCDNHRGGWLIIFKLCTLFLPHPYFWLTIGQYWLIPLVGSFLFLTYACHNFYMNRSVFWVTVLHQRSSGGI